MKLVPLFQDFFDFVSRARLQMGTGVGEFGRLSATEAIERIDREIERMRDKKNKLPELAALVQDQDVLFADMRTFATWVLAGGASEAAKSINIHRRQRDTTQDSKFREHVQQELKSVNPAVAERLVIYAICYGLGYRGVDDEKAVLRIRGEIWPHIRGIVASPRKEHPKSPHVPPLFSESYSIRTDNLHAPAVRWGAVYAACAVGFVAVAIAVIKVKDAGGRAEEAIESILAQREKTLEQANLEKRDGAVAGGNPPAPIPLRNP